MRDAFKEAEAISRGTRCRQYLFSLSLNPPAEARLPVSDFIDAIDTIETRLGLEGQPRAVIFHEKEGRRHAHCVWSRIDAESMTARHLPFFKTRLMGVARDLYLTHGWEMPAGIENANARNPTNFTLAEWQQSKRTGLDPRWLKAQVQSCWQRSDGIKAFSHALEERGLYLAKGDRRDFVVLTHDGDIHALPRLLNEKTKAVRVRLGSAEGFRGVAATKKVISNAMTPALRAHVETARQGFARKAAPLYAARDQMTEAHRAARKMLEDRLERERQEEAQTRAARLPKGLKGLWHRIIGRFQDLRRQAEAEAQTSAVRHEAERQALIDRQREKRAILQRRIKELRDVQATKLADLRRNLTRYRSFQSDEAKGVHASEIQRRRKRSGPSL
ncbi:relaxase [Jiella sp. LLJ827]|uniref:relaxase/mobilization nuclease domain-containing protein n=1 Tax=Jiella sp. LLJ827 TaxID=2917712 RepID=UPI00210125F5|nr:relaxase [Jiella sp. LLJ827]MCQ0990348.1 relaxase [Jiella sp. LLJ827]